MEEFCYQLRTQKEPVIQFTRNVNIVINTAKPKIIEAGKSMKSIFLALSLSVGAQHLVQTGNLSCRGFSMSCFNSDEPAPCSQELLFISPWYLQNTLQSSLSASLPPCATLWLLAIWHQAHCQLDSIPLFQVYLPLNSTEAVQHPIFLKVDLQKKTTNKKQQQQQQPKQTNKKPNIKQII